MWLPTAVLLPAQNGKFNHLAKNLCASLVAMLQASLPSFNDSLGGGIRHPSTQTQKQNRAFRVSSVRENRDSRCLSDQLRSILGEKKDDACSLCCSYSFAI